MERWRTKVFISLLFLFTLLLVASCSAKEAQNEPDEKSEKTEAIANGNQEEELEPVTLLMMTHWNDEQFEAMFKNHIEEKFDHITLEHVRAKSDEIEEKVFAKKLYPDIIMTSVTEYYLEMDLLLDLNPLIEEFDFDLDRLKPSILDYLKKQSNEGELNGLPFIRPDYALVYNSDIFDLFGVDYPTDNMTWEEVTELARKVTGKINGVQYRGLHPGTYDFMMRQLEDSKLIDPETNKPNIDENEGFNVYLERLEQIYSIPGNAPATAEDMVNEAAVNLMREGHLAMAADRAFPATYASATAESGTNFDFVTFPSWGGEFGDYGPNEPGNGLAATTTTKHPKEAFRVLQYLLSDEYQMWLSGQGDLPAVVTQEVNDAFMKDHEHYDIIKDKNLKAITNVEPAPLSGSSPYEKEILEGTNYREGIFEEKDINTIIREMQDKAEGNAKDVLSKQ